MRCTVGAMKYPRAVASLGLLALAGLVMLPRLASPQFGLLDDGLTLQTGREVVGRWSSVLHLIPETGRFFPAYWLVYSIIAGAAGARPLAFFAINVLLLAGLLAILARLVRAGGGTRRHVAVAVVAFAACGPAIEAFYTLSKAEPLQLTWIGLSLLATAAAAVDASRVRRAGLIAVGGVALVLAHATKETSLVLVPIALGWLAAERTLLREAGAGQRFALIYVALTLAAAAAFAALRWHYAPLDLAEGTYTRAYALHATTVRAALLRIVAWLTRDFAFLLPLLLGAGLSLVAGKPASRRPLLYAGIWMTGWLAVFLPWPATFEYYLLPFAFGAAVLTATVAGDAWALRTREHAAGRRRFGWSLLAATGLLWLASTANAVADARVQLTVDRANAALVDFLGRLPTGSRVVVNTRLNEYVAELPLHLAEIEGRPDLVVQPVATRSALGASPAAVFVATPQMADPPAPTVRIPLDAAGVGQGLATLTTLLDGQGDLVYRSELRTPLVEIGFHRLLCRPATGRLLGASFCPGDRALIVRRPFSYGWQVHRLGPAPGRHVETRHDG